MLLLLAPSSWMPMVLLATIWLLVIVLVVGESGGLPVSASRLTPAAE